MIAWVTITAADFLAQGLNPSEKAAITSLAAATDNIPAILAAAIAQYRGVLSAAGNTLDADGTTPPSLQPDVLAVVRWRLLIAFPAFKALQTDVRKDEYEAAMKRLDEIAQNTRAVESPVESDFGTGGASGTEVNIKMRTSQL